jgi:hypothetical protein
VDNCIRTNPASGYVDDQKNAVGIGGVSVGGKNTRVIIYDNFSNVVTSFNQTFTKEEKEMDSRGNENDHSKLGFLYWNERSSEGRKVGDGVYIWRIDFKFNDGHKEYRLLKTGVKRHK